MSEAARLARLVRDSRGVAHKRDIAGVIERLGLSAAGATPVGDDTAVISDPRGGYLLFAIEGFVADFVAADPWFAGYCGVMVNVSDIAAMGGRPTAVVDAVWSNGEDEVAAMLEGMRSASARYGVPIVGGHANLRAAGGQLAVAILGETRCPLTSFAARPGDAVIVVTDLRGQFRDPYPWWDASTATTDVQRLRDDLGLLPALSADGLVRAGKDISMAGVVGTGMMLAEASGVGIAFDLARLPRPDGVAFDRWLTAFPSFGFVFTADPGDAAEVITRFSARGIAADIAGKVTADRRVTVSLDGEEATVWDFAETFIGCSITQAGQNHA